MPLNNGNTVAVERRVDLASLFCMIGRHGPAVALALVAMASLLAGFIIYRTVRGKRRKATAADDDSKSPAEESDASVIQPSSVESTEGSDEGSSDVKDVDLKIRHRRAAEKTPPPYSPPKSDIHIPDDKHTTSDDTDKVAVEWDSYKVAETYADGANWSRQSATSTEAEMVLEDAVDCHQGETDDAIKDVLEEVRDKDSCWKEPEPNNDENHEEKVLKADCQEDEDVTTDMDHSDKTTRQEEENVQRALTNLAFFEKNPHMSENSDDDRPLEETINGVESNSEEPLIHIEDVDVPCVCYGKDEEESPDRIDDFSYLGNTLLSPEEEKKNGSEEAEEECVDQQLIDQQAEIWSSTSRQETNWQEQCDQEMDKVTPPMRDSDWDEDDCLAGETIKEDEDHLNILAAVKCDARSPQFDEQDVEFEQKEENGLACDQEDGVLYDDQVKEKMLTGDNTVACSEEPDSSSMAPSPALPCLSVPIKAINPDDGLSGITTDAKAQISGIAEFPDLSSDRRHPQKEDKIAPAPDEDTNSSTILGLQMPSHETENQAENNVNGTALVLAEEQNNQVHDPPVKSCCEDEQSVQTIRNEMCDEASVAAAPEIIACDGEKLTVHVMADVFDKASVADSGTVDEVSETASVIAEEISCPHLPSTSQDQQSGRMEINETFEKMRVDSTTGAAACDNASCAALSMSVEISHPDMSSSSQDQESDQTKDFFEVGTPIMIEDINPPMCQIPLPSFEQFDLRNDTSSAGVGEESGISSMTVSPDNEFDVSFENTVLPVMDWDPRKSQNLFANDAAVSVVKEDTAGMVCGLYPSRHSQPPHSERTGGTNYESFAANEDMLGHEVEDSYHRGTDQFMAQVADSVTSFTDDLEKHTDVKVVVEVKEEGAGVSANKKEENKAEKEIEVDNEMTEISIMEATMEHNEWIMDGTYQALPWMNLSAPSFAQDGTKTNQLPTEEYQCSSDVTDSTRIDTTDIPPSAEVKQTSALSLVDENTENNKKIGAVQPMPQHVNVTFRIHYFTQSPYQTVAVTGNQQELGNWKGFIPLERAKDGHWSTVVSLPAEIHVEWKFVVVDKGEVCRWEECGNRLLDTGNGDDLLVHKWWGRL
ncbi:hypothetical protein PFLUV_G00199620 [Perca fluviatilis]|uniref:Starch-binding domain-containing protein 1 n=1 Tax=Perca fluviatilis TaxID=8168 RepID=A0A6A5E9A9_PERFL|nr:uncharacterized protein stbd1 [Perca fluviatilis]KAF1377330.1 hypothetical protein PFLUV_G00199620 [Perca fluviatilis]